MRLSFLIIFFLLYSNLLFSKKDPIRYGKISNFERNIQKTNLDPNADAIILCDFGEINFSGNSVEITRHTRIKILNQNGLDEANIILPYISKDNREQIFKVKAQTININSEGNLEKIKVKKGQIFTIDVNDILMEKRFTFPGVKPGSIIEYQYTKITKKVVTLEKWIFQNKLPTLKSHLNVVLGNNLDFKIVYNGNRLINKYGNNDSNSWFLENLPPIKEESYCPNPMDYIESIQFQLAGYRRYSSMPNGETEYVKLITSWDNLGKEMLSFKAYKDILNQKKESKKLVNQIINEDEDDLEKVKKIYSFIQNEIDWNGNYHLFPEENFSTILEQKRGSSSEINLCFISLMQSAGLEANPLIISTKGNGLITKKYPLYNQFNHVLAQVKVGEEDILMDAIGKFRPYNLLAKNDLKPDGFLLHRSNPRWIPIKYPTRTKSIIVTNLEFEENKIKLNISYAFFEHKAVEYRRILYHEEEKESFITKYLQSTFEGNNLNLDSFKIKNPNDLERPFLITCYFSKAMGNKLDSEVFYLNPFVKKHLNKNPFVNPVRYLPVDFILPYSEKFIYNLKIPEGFEIAEIPKSIKYSTYSKKVSYTYRFSPSEGGKVQLSSTYKVIHPLIMPDEYGALRELYNKMMGLQSIQLVLKRR